MDLRSEYAGGGLAPLWEDEQVKGEALLVHTVKPLDKGRDLACPLSECPTLVHSA